MAKMTEKKKGKIKWWLTITSVILSIATLVAVCVGLGNIADTKKVDTNDYAIGTIAETGKIVESKQSAYMKDAESVDGLVIDIDEETATITYKVAFYDEDGKFISMTESQETDFDTANVPENAETFRVVITPYQVDGENVELNIFNMGKYTSQLDVSYNK